MLPVLGSLGMAALVGCGPARQENESAPTNVAGTPESNVSAVPLPQPPMDRAALLQAVALARSAAAAGTDDRAAQRELGGKPFEVRIRFGCEGLTAELDSKMFGWSYDQQKHVLRVRATPTLTGKDPLPAKLAPADVEAVEGFWLARPWLLSDSCPVRLSAPQPTVQGAPADSGGKNSEAETMPSTVTADVLPPSASAKVGIAQFFTADDPRTARRENRPYEAVKTLDPARAVGSSGFDLVLSGRLRPFSGGRVIHCVVHGPDVAPDCIVSADFDRVWIEEPASHSTIAEWSAG